MCHRMGRPPISTIGLGRRCVSSLIRVPSPPARITPFIDALPPSEQRFVFSQKFAPYPVDSAVAMVARTHERRKSLPQHLVLLRVNRAPFRTLEHLQRE